MSLTTVQSKIRSAMRDRLITETEAKGIVKEAEKNGVTVGEGKAVADLFAKGPRNDPPGMMHTMAIPEHPGEVMFQAGAKSVLEAFFDKNLVPAGPTASVVQAKVKMSLEGVDLGEKLKKAPSTSRLYEVAMQPAFINPDLPRETAYVDVKHSRFFIKLEGGFTRDPSAKFYGPFQLKAAQPRAQGV